MTKKGHINKQTLLFIKEEINRVAVENNRNPIDITLVAVTKAFPVSAMISAYNSNILVMGESKVQETIEKLPHYPHTNKTELRLIGHLQSNKSNKAVEIYNVIETVDSIKILKKINQSAKNNNKTQRILLQFNTGKDPAKYGFFEEEKDNVLEVFLGLNNVKCEGVMTIAPFTNNIDILNQTFTIAKETQNYIKKQIPTCKNLSMGMSNDYKIAIKHGATHIRIGTALFGKRI
jgi:PLP dependent protein